MFTKEELLIILQNTTNKTIREKVNSMLFVDTSITDEIIRQFKNKGLLKIEKSTDSNEYYVHFEEDMHNIIDTIQHLNDIAFTFKTQNTLAEIHTIEHENIENIWWHGDMIQVWTRRDVCLN